MRSRMSTQLDTSAVARKARHSYLPSAVGTLDTISMSANRKSKYSTQLSHSLLSFIFRILDTISDAKSLWQLPADKFTDLFVKP